MNHLQTQIERGEMIVGIELGSTRIKSVLLNEQNEVVAMGSYQWENQQVDGIWTYSLDAVWEGLSTSYARLVENVKEKYGVGLKKIKALGISAMMHGYMVFDKDNQLLVPFRTWRNTMTAEATDVLTELFQYNIPQRWSIAHLYQEILEKKEYVNEITYMTTLSGYIHWCLTGEKVLGIGDASGMFPIDVERKTFHKKMMEQFQEQIKTSQYAWKLEDILPTVLVAGEEAGYLTEQGAKLLDKTGELEAGCPLCPPEGDAGTGMVATNSVAIRTGNVSAGTSVFAMVVLEKELTKVYREIDMVTTPDGSLVAMVHANNCTSDLDAWVSLFQEYSQLLGVEIDLSKQYSLLYNKALEGDHDCGNLLSCGFYSGENMIEIHEGRPLFLRMPNSKFTLANVMKSHLYSSIAMLKIGMNLLKEEKIHLDKICGHGGFFKTKNVGQRIMAAAMETSVVVSETASEGGAFGIGVLASYMIRKEKGETLEQYLNSKIFQHTAWNVVVPEQEEIDDFQKYVDRFQQFLVVEKVAVEQIRNH